MAIAVTITSEDLQCTIEWDSDAGWSPDVALDMCRRAVASIIAMESAHLEDEADDG